MTELNRPLTRKTRAHRHEQGRDRRIVVVLDGQVMGFRLFGTRRIYWMDIESAYCQAVKAQVAKEKREQRKAKR